MSFGKVDFTEYLVLPLLLVPLWYCYMVGQWSGSEGFVMLSSYAANGYTVCATLFVVYTDKTNNRPAEHILFIPRLVFFAVDYAVVHMEC